MAAVLVSLSDFKGFLGLSGTAQDSVLGSVLDGVEQLLLEQAGRPKLPFIAAGANGRTEHRAATGVDFVALDYPVSALTGSILLGFDSANPDESLDTSDPTVIKWEAGSRLVYRVDGGVFGAGDALINSTVPVFAPGVTPSAQYVHVTYDSQADAPASCALAVKRAAALVYWQLGAEDLVQERLAMYERQLAKFGDDPIWRMGVDAARRLQL